MCTQKIKWRSADLKQKLGASNCQKQLNGNFDEFLEGESRIA